MRSIIHKGMTIACSAKRIVFSILALAFSSLCVFAQTAPVKPFDRLDVGVSVGSTGIGAEISTPITSWAKVRAGVGVMPQFTVPMSFGISSYVEGQGVRPIGDKLDKLDGLLSDFVGLTIDDRVDMNAKATMVDVKLLFDFYPLRNKHWRVTAGFYWGSGKVGHIENNIHEMPTLMGIVVYNNLYDYFTAEKYLDAPIYKDMYIDPEVGDKVRDKFVEYGMLGAHIGDFKDTGKPYMMVPGEDGVIEADMHVNKFKPYLGLGYECNLSKDGKWRLGCDAGAMFWGGMPKIMTHNNLNMENVQVDMARDLVDIPGRVGTYVDIAKSLKVYPTLYVSITYNLF